MACRFPESKVQQAAIGQVSWELRKGPCRLGTGSPEHVKSGGDRGTGDLRERRWEERSRIQTAGCGTRKESGAGG